MNYFGTDGMRGCAGIIPITKEYFYKIGRALATILQEEDGQLQVIIGRDTRDSGKILESAIRDGLIDGGLNCLMVGVLPTPGISYLTNKTPSTMGIVISASHNHSTDNGIKIFLSNGDKIDSNYQDNIVRILESNEYFKPVGLGTISQYDGMSIYQNKCLESTSIRLNTTIKVVVDCANGAASKVAKLVFSKAFKNIEFMNSTPNGANINLNCGSTNTKELASKVIQSGADIGIAFDGDADRLIIIDASGNELNGDDLVYILANHWKEMGLLKNNIVVGTIMTNYGTRESINSSGIKFIESAVGDKHVLKKMLEHKSILGGEDSGHIICMDKIGCGDGIISSLQVLEVMIDTGKTLEELNSTNLKHYYLTKTIKITDDTNINHPEFTDYLLDKKNEFKKNGRIVIRESGTEPVIRILIEHKNKNICDSTMESILKVIN